MNREQKAAAIAEIAGEIEESQAVFAVDSAGSPCRRPPRSARKLRDADATLPRRQEHADRARGRRGRRRGAQGAAEGPTALTFVRGDAAAAAKAITDYARTTELLPFKGGCMDGAPLDVDADQGHRQAAVARRALRPARRHGRLADHRPGPRAQRAAVAASRSRSARSQAKAEAGEITLGRRAGGPRPRSPTLLPRRRRPRRPTPSRRPHRRDRAPRSADQDAEAPRTRRAEEPAEGTDDHRLRDPRRSNEKWLPAPQSGSTSSRASPSSSSPSASRRSRRSSAFSATAVAAAAPAAGGGGDAGARRGGVDAPSTSSSPRRRQEDPGHQGRPRGDRPGPEGGQGARRRGAQARQGGHRARRGREAQGRARGGRRLRRAQVAPRPQSDRHGGHVARRRGPRRQARTTSSRRDRQLHWRPCTATPGVALPATYRRLGR